MIADWTPDRIRTLRKAMGQTQEQFAVHFRLHPEAVRTWEQARGGPSGPATVILDQLAVKLSRRQAEPEEAEATAS